MNNELQNNLIKIATYNNPRFLLFVIYVFLLSNFPKYFFLKKKKNTFHI